MQFTKVSGIDGYCGIEIGECDLEDALSMLTHFWKSMNPACYPATMELTLGEWTDRGLEIRSRYEGEKISIYRHGSDPKKDKMPLPDEVIDWIWIWWNAQVLRKLRQQITDLTIRRDEVSDYIQFRLSEKPDDWVFPDA